MEGYSLDSTTRKPFLPDMPESFATSDIKNENAQISDNSFLDEVIGKVSLLDNLTSGVKDMGKVSYDEILQIDSVLKMIQNDMLNGLNRKEMDLFKGTEASKKLTGITACYEETIKDFNVVAMLIDTKINSITSIQVDADNFDKYEKSLAEIRDILKGMTPKQKTLFNSSGKDKELIKAEKAIEQLNTEHKQEMLKVDAMDALVNNISIKELALDNQEQVEATLLALKAYKQLTDKQKNLFKKEDKKRVLLPQKLDVAGTKLQKLVTVVASKIELEKLEAKDKANIDYMMKISAGLEDTEYKLNDETKKILKNAQTAIENKLAGKVAVSDSAKYRTN